MYYLRSTNTRMDKKVLDEWKKQTSVSAELIPLLTRILNLSEDMEVPVAMEVYQACVGVNQSQRSKKGKSLEKIIENLLMEHDIPYLSQAAVDTATGTICKSSRSSKSTHIHDFIIDAKLGDTIHDKIVLSCKTSLRERWRQDANIKCKKLYMITLEAASKTITASLEENNITLVMVGAKEGTPLEQCIQEIKDTLVSAKQD